MGIIFKPKRIQQMNANTNTSTIEPGEIFIVKNNSGAYGPLNSFELFCNIDTSSTTVKNIVKTGHDTSDTSYSMMANYLKMSAIDPTDKNEIEFTPNLINSVKSLNLGTRIADITQAVCAPRLIWTTTIANKDATVDINCNFKMSGAAEYRRAILIIMITDVTVSSTGPLIPVILPDPLNFIGKGGTINYTYRGGYYQGSTNGGGAYFKITQPDATTNTIRIALDQAYINGTGKSGLTGQYVVKVLYEKYSKSFWDQQNNN